MEGSLVASRYRVQRRVASGGMGVVYEAIHVETGRRVALKLLHKSAFFASDAASWVARMKREARVAGALDTPHVVQVLDAGELDDGETYIAMEFLKGSDLRTYLQTTGPLPADVAARIVAQACLGVSAAHAAGILHRDLKPGNLFLAADELGGVTVKVLDFGIAKITSDPGLTRITATGQLIGTPTYVSPEQARGLSDVDERTDVWSLGVVLYRLLCGKPPHELSGSLTDFLVTLCTVPAAPIRERAPSVPEALARIVGRALEIDRERRYPSVRALFDELAAFSPELRLTVRDLAPRSAVPPPREHRAAPGVAGAAPATAEAASKPQPRPVALVAVALVLTLLLGFVSGVAVGRRSAPAAPTATAATVPRAADPMPSPSLASAATHPLQPLAPPAAPRADASTPAEPTASAPMLPSRPDTPPPAPSASVVSRRRSGPAASALPGAPAPATSRKPRLEFETGFE